jgi:flagellar biosynthesis/type III secretory pathway M-ring protein FliF/YscJ
MNKPDNSFTTYFQHIGDSPSNLFGQLFSRVFGIMNWFIGLRWYVILLIVVLGSYLFIQMEYAIESRRQTREQKQKLEKEKEGMEELTESSDSHKKSRGILRQKNGNIKKHVSFYDEEQEYDSTTISMFISQLYNWWILPWIYVFFRNTGFR